MSTHTNRDLLVRMTSLGAHLTRLKPNMKQPSESGWTLAPAITPTEAEAYVAAGGNLGVNQALSRLVVLDAENEAATAALLAAGFELTVIPAKAQYQGILKPGLPDPDSGKENRKYGGSHVWLRVPDGIDAGSLPADRLGIELPGGGKIDALAGRRYVVAPPSALELVYGGRYAPAAGGLLDLDTPLREVPVAPMWLFDATVPCPPGLDPLHGILVPAPTRERVEQNARSAELSGQIDEVPWDQWLAADHRLTDTDEVDGCGCAVWHWLGAEHDKSVTLHDGCSVGNGAHIWSGTMIGQLGLTGDHLSRLDLACALRGESRRAVASTVGISLGEEHEELGAVTASTYERTALHFELRGEAERAAVFRQAAAAMRASAPTPEQRGETFTSGQVLGAPQIGTVHAPTVGANALKAAPSAAEEPDNVVPLRPPAPPNFDSCVSSTAGETAAEPELTPEEKAAAEAEAAAEALADKRDPYRHLADPCDEELEEKVFGDPLLPEVGLIRTVARAAAMSPWSTLGLSIGRGLLRVRSSVMFPPLVGGTPAPLNFQLGVVGASGRGKGAAHGLVTFDAQWERTLATEESIDKKFMPPSGAALAGLFVARQKDDEGNLEVVPIREAAWCDWSEVDTLTAQSGRGGNDLASELRAAITGAELGTDPKKDGADPLKVDPLSYRILVSFSTQYGKPAAGLLAEKDGGTLQRTAWFSTTDPRSLTKRPRGVTPQVDISIMRDLPASHVQTHPDGDRSFLTVDDGIWDEVWEAQAAKIRHDRDVDELGGHENLNRLRVAAWAALVRHKAHIGEFEWKWAGHVMEHSRRVRDRLEASVKGLKKAQAVENGGLDFDRKNAAELAKVAHTEALLSALAKWGRDVREGRNKFGRSGPTFTLRDIRASAKNAQSERYTRAEELATELCMRQLWVNDGERMRSVEADPE